MSKKEMKEQLLEELEEAEEWLRECDDLVSAYDNAECNAASDDLYSIEAEMISEGLNPDERDQAEIDLQNAQDEVDSIKKRLARL